MEIDSLKIGDVVTSPNLMLAPMSGVTCPSFRKLMREENPDSLGLVVTEFVSIEGLTRGNKSTCKLLNFTDFERPISIQIFGYDISKMIEAAKIVEDTGAEILDINCGCPVPRVVSRGGGCQLMREADHLGEMLARVVEAVNIPVTLKTRTGWDENSLNALDIGKVAESSGIKMLAIHGRTRQQLYRGIADWDLISSVARSLEIPVVGSGDIVNIDFAKKAFASGVKGLMIGRGAMENPFIFSDIKEYLTSGLRIKRKPSDYIRVLLRYYDLILAELGPRGTSGKMKQFICHITKSLPNGENYKRTLCRLGTCEEIRASLLSWHEIIDDTINLSSSQNDNQRSSALDAACSQIS